MLEIAPGIFIGDLEDYKKSEGLAVLSATQTVHYQKLGWTRKTVDRNSPNYLDWEGGKHMTLNWVDGSASYYTLGGHRSFSKALDWISGHTPCLVHCNKGESRSATLGLLYLAKRLQSIEPASFEAARDDFIKIYPKYKPGGIAGYVSKHWLDIT